MEPLGGGPAPNTLSLYKTLDKIDNVFFFSVKPDKMSIKRLIYNSSKICMYKIR